VSFCFPRSSSLARGQGYAGEMGYGLGGLKEALAFAVLQEPEMIPFRVAAEAVEEAFLVIDVEGRGFLVMERAGGLPVALRDVGLAQVPGNMGAHDRGQWNAGAQLIKEGRAEGHDGSSFECREAAGTKAARPVARIRSRSRACALLRHVSGGR